MNSAGHEFLKHLIDAPSPSGYEQAARAVWKHEVSKFVDDVRTDVHGNVIANRNPTGSPRLMFAGHCDELGLQINYISDQGYLYFNTIGGHDPNLIAGRRVLVHTSNGPIRGVTGRRAIHLTPRTERGSAQKIEDIWIDIGVNSMTEAEELVRVGDSVTYDLGMSELRNGLAIARAFDNKVGAWVVAEALRRVDIKNCTASVFSVATVQEEIGLRGAVTSTFGIAPLVGVAVDVSHATDHPNINKVTAGNVSLAGGPVITRGANVNPVVEHLLIESADALDLSVQIEAEPRGTGTDANAIQLTRSGVATGVVSVPLRYMHTPSEIISLEVADQTADLLAEFACRVTAETDFTP